MVRKMILTAAVAILVTDSSEELSLLSSSSHRAEELEARLRRCVEVAPRRLDV